MSSGKQTAIFRVTPVRKGRDDKFGSGGNCGGFIASTRTAYIGTDRTDMELGKRERYGDVIEPMTTTADLGQGTFECARRT